MKTPLRATGTSQAPSNVHSATWSSTSSPRWRSIWYGKRSCLVIFSFINVSSNFNSYTEDSHRRPSLRVRSVREEVCAEQQPSAAHENAHGRETVRLRDSRVRQIVLRRLCSKVSRHLSLRLIQMRTYMYVTRAND